MMANETSSTDITDRHLSRFLVDYDNANAAIPARHREIVGGCARRPDVDVPSSARARRFRTVIPSPSEDVLFQRSQVALRREPASGHAGTCCSSTEGTFVVSAPDPHTVVINTGKPHAGLLDRVVHRQSADHPEARAARMSYKSGNFASAYNVSTPPDKIVTSGAWRLSQYVPDEKTVLGRNPYCFGFDQANSGCRISNELIILIVPDQDAADLKFRVGRARRGRQRQARKLPVVRATTRRAATSLCTSLGAAKNTPILLVQPEQGAAADARSAAGTWQTHRRAASSIR